jgi:FkbM family methyltransferase
MNALKPYVQTFLSRIGVYHRLKASHLYDLYWNISNKRVINERQREVEFYRTVLQGLPKPALIFDIGANQGYKTDIFLRLGARVVAIEPDRSNQAILSQKFLRYRFVNKEVVVVGKALSDKNAVETMWIDAPGSGKNSLSLKWVESLRVNPTRFGARLEFTEQRQVETTTVEQLINTYGRPFFIKIDVEGYEAMVLQGLERPVPYLSFEVNLPDFKSEGLQCIERLRELDAKGSFNYAADCLDELELQQWLNATEFREVLDGCQEKSIEVFWKASV